MTNEAHSEAITNTSLNDKYDNVSIGMYFDPKARRTPYIFLLNASFESLQFSTHTQTHIHYI